MRTLEQNEEIIEKGLRSFIEIGEAFAEIQESKQYKTYGTWEKYLKDRWKTTDRNVNYLINAAKIARTLEKGTIVPLLPTAETQVRPLKKLSSEKQIEVWNKAVEKSGGKVPTEKVVRATVQEETHIPASTLTQIAIDEFDRVYKKIEPFTKIGIDSFNPEAFKSSFDRMFNEETELCDEAYKREFAKQLILACLELYPSLQEELDIQNLWNQNHKLALNSSLRDS